MPRIAARRPDYDDQAAVEKTSGDKPRLGTFAAVGCAGNVQIGKDFARAGEIKAALLQRLGAFDLGPSHLHIIYVPP